MFLPDVAFQHGPFPNAPRIALPTTFTITKQVEHESRQVENGLVHDVTRKTSRRLEDTAETVEDTDLPDSSIAPSLLVLGVSLGSQDGIQIRSIFCWINWGKICDVDVRMIARWVVRAQRSKQDRVIVRPSNFVSSNKRTEQSASLSPMVAHRAAQIGHTNGVCKSEENEE